MTKYSSIRLILAKTGKMDSVVRHVKSAFLNATLEEEIFMRQPPGFEDKNQPRQSVSFEEEHLLTETNSSCLELSVEFCSY